MSKSISAKCGHVKRKLNSGEPLTGKVLEFALTLLGEDDEIARKLIAGEKLDDYEQHIMIDVYLLHAKLSG